MLASKLFSTSSKVLSNSRGVAGRKYSSLPSYLLNAPPTKVSSLPSKLRVATEENYGETATVGVFINTGSRFETAKNNGVAHFLEHMTFKGTNNRSRSQLEVEIENMGATMNAYTSREQTVYYMKVFKNDVPKAVEVLADVLQNSKLDEKYIEAERGTILREQEEVSKDYNEVMFDHLHSVAFQGTSLGRTILGSSDNIKTISKSDLQDYIKTHYTAPRFVVAGAGAVNHEDLSALAQKHFAGLPSGSSTTKEPTKFSGGMITVRDDTMEDLHISVAFEGVNWSSPDYFALMVMQQMIGSWDRTIGGGKNLSSFLCERFATEGLAKSLTTFNTCYTDTGLFGCYAITDHHNAENTVFEILREFNRIANNAHDSEVDRAKARLKASLLMNLDGTTAVCEDIGRQVSNYGRRLTPAEIFLRIDAVTTKDVMRVAYDRAQDFEPAVVAIGNLQGFPDYNQIREWTYWRRM